MAILNFQVSEVGQTGQAPKFIFFETNNTIDQVIATGFLNKFVAAGNKVSETDMAVVSTRTTPNAKSSQVELFNVTYSAGNWSLTPNATPLTLDNGKIYIGNASGIATGITLSGDATVTNSGVLTIANGAVTLAKLAASITPAYITKYAGTGVTNSGAITIIVPITGVVSTDIAQAQFTSTINPVAISTVLPGLNQITIAATGDPGSDVAFSYQILRAAS